MLIFVYAAFCSWDESTSVRSFYTSSLQPLLITHNRTRTSLPSSCPFRTSLNEDKLQPYYSFKQKETQFFFKCSECSKEFRSEKSVHDHIVRAHAPDEGVCLGDFCMFLPCGRLDEITRNRCREVMTECFDYEMLEKALDFCEYREESFWDLELEKPGYIVFGILSVVVCFIYYLLLWAEMEENITIVKKQKKKMS